MAEALGSVWGALLAVMHCTNLGSDLDWGGGNKQEISMLESWLVSWLRVAGSGSTPKMNLELFEIKTYV